MKLYLPALLCLSISLSCGKKDSKNSNPPPTNQPPPAQNEDKGKQFQSKVFATSADLPSCDAKLSGALAYVLVTKTFQTCDSTAWLTIDVAEKPSSGGAGLGVFDTNGDKVGSFTGPFLRSSEISYDLLLQDGTLIKMNKYTFTSDLFETGKLPLDGAGCFYTSADCTGMCYRNSGFPSGLSMDSSGKLRVVSGEAISIAYKSRFDGVTCGPGAGASFALYETRIWAPTQFKYPFALPLSVR